MKTVFMPIRYFLLLVGLTVGGFAATSRVSFAQQGQPSAADLFPDLSLGRYGQIDSPALNNEDPADLSATYYLVTDKETSGKQVLLSVRVKLAEAWHIYSLTQPKGGPLPTRLELKDPAVFDVVSKWQSDQSPTRSVSQEFENVTIEEHSNEVIFFVLATPADTDVSIASLGDISVSIEALACVNGGACLPIDETLVAKFGGDVEQAAPYLADLISLGMAAGPEQPMQEPSDLGPLTQENLLADGPPELNSEQPQFRDDDYSVAWQAEVQPATLAPGQTGFIVFNAFPDNDYHVYPLAVDDAKKSTIFVVENKSGLLVGAPQTSSSVITKEPFPGIVDRYHAGPVRWVVPVQVPVETMAGSYPVSGAVAYQACTDRNCLMPMAMTFQANVTVVESIGNSVAASVPIQLASTTARDVMKVAGSTPWVDTLVTQPDPASIASAPEVVSEVPAVVELELTSESSESDVSFLATLGFAFIGGFILNFMPCVLPVVGLKVMSFVQQAGENRTRIFMLNFVYAIGILSVFALLAGLAVGLSFSWGEQFTYVEFRLGLAILLFAMALSYLGVWEIPAPSFAAGKKSADLQSQEGYVGAFFKGVFATLLATPCSGPLLGYIFGATINLSPVQTVAIMLVVGVGMAVPYVIIGAFPSLVSWLPKPGPWMETLKEFLAFLFLGTVAFFFYGFADETKMAVFVTFIGVWFGCWIIGKVPSWQTIGRRLTAWAAGVAAATAIGLWAFSALVPSGDVEELIRWQPYSESKLAQLQDEGKTVMLDFTADWCVNCKVNEKFALNTELTSELIDELDAVAMVADWTDRKNTEIKDKLQELQSRSIPVLAIYPGTNPESPIILRDLVSQQSVLDALREAGPSQSSSSKTNVASKANRSQFQRQ